MIELMEWTRSVSFPDKPWLILGKGPSFSRRGEFDLSQYNLLSLNHVVRQEKVDVAHIIDLDVVRDCGEALLHNCRWLLMPRRPHLKCAPGRFFLLEDFVQADPILRALDAQGRLIWYNLSSGAAVGKSPAIRVRYFSSEAALNILARLGVKTIRSLGLDGGRGYSADFHDLEEKTHLANGHATFDIQFAELRRIVADNSLDYAPLVEPMRVFVGTDEASMLGTRLLEYSIRKFASGPVEVVPMLNVPVPMPKDPANRPRTGFSFSRFLIPRLCNYRGRALYLDSDMQVFADLSELWRIPFGNHKVLCTNQPEIPAAWKDNPGFHPGRQMSVMLLDCARLDWDIEPIVQGLDQGKYTYQQLMFDLCLVKPEEIADAIPPEWNCLEHYEPGKTKLLHYTVAPIQPWKNEDNPLRGLWLDCFQEAIRSGAISPEEVRRQVRAGTAKANLADYLHLAPQPGQAPVARSLSGTGNPLAARMEEAELALRQLLDAQAELAALRQSWSWKIGRALTRPLSLLRQAIKRSFRTKAS